MMILGKIRFFSLSFSLCLPRWMSFFILVIKPAIDCSMTGFADNSRFLTIFSFSWMGEWLPCCATKKKCGKLRQFTIEIIIICGYYCDVLRWEPRMNNYIPARLRSSSRGSNAQDRRSYVLSTTFPLARTTKRKINTLPDYCIWIFCCCRKRLSFR